MKIYHAVATLLIGSGAAFAAVEYPGQAPGAAKASPANTASPNYQVHYVVSNNLFTAEFSESS
ncbi:MAG: hypothetical protein MJ056_07805, partial [Akkermansia sp.]|nr:hypothetical protein [Akkermansia sp.]